MFVESEGAVRVVGIWEKVYQARARFLSDGMGRYDHRVMTDDERRDVVRLVERLAGGEVRALARAISLVEQPGDLADAVVAASREVGRKARRIGVTGAPGAGKSTLVDRMVRALCERVAVLAVDPTSPFTGGALLGDRIRMQGFAADADVFIRSMASRGATGGLAAGVAGACAVLEAAGFSTIVVETVGVGQEEVAVTRLADATVLVLVPGMGDDVQSLKAGVMEAADVFAVNKADLEGADRTVAEVRAMQSLVCVEGWVAPVVKTIASTGEGVEALLEAVSGCIEQRASAGVGAR
jgi:LAO/AO transport system kinase